MDICLRVLKESNNRIFDSCSARNSVLIISHITFRDCRVHIFADNLSRNSCIWTKCKSQKSWLTWAICTNFSSLHAILKEISAIENFEIAGWQKVNEPYILCNIEFLKETFSETIRYMGLKFSEITEIVTLFQYSEVLSDNDEQMLMRPKM